MEEELGWGRSQLFIPLTVSVLSTALVAPLLGRYLDRKYGALVILVVSVSLLGARLLGVAQVDNFWPFLFFFGVMGGFATFGTQAMTGVIVPKWFVRRRSNAVSIAILGSSAAAFATPLLINGLDSAYGWRTTWVLLGVAILLVAVPLTLLVRRRPEDVGLVPDQPRRGHESANSEPLAYERSFTLAEARRTKVIWLLMAAIGLGSFAWMGVPMTIVSLGIDRGISSDTGAWAFSFYGLLSMSARFWWSYMADRTHVRIAMITACLFGATGILLTVPWLHLPVVFFAFAAVSGFTIGGLIVLQPLIWAAYFGREHLGAITGMVTPVTTIGLAIGPLTLAASSDVLGRYEPGIIGIGLIWLLAAFIMTYARPLTESAPPDQEPAPLPATH